MPWPRSRLVKKPDGLFYCPDDRDGRDPVTLARLNAQRRPRSVYPPMDASTEASASYSAAGVVPMVEGFIALENGQPLQYEDEGWVLLEEST